MKHLDLVYRERADSLGRRDRGEEWIVFKRNVIFTKKFDYLVDSNDAVMSKASSQSGQSNGPKRVKQPSLATRLVNTNKLLPAETIELELFGSVDPVPLNPYNEAAPAVAGKPGSKAALQKLASSFAALNRRKAEKREREQSNWRSIIQGALDLQKGKIPLLLAVEAGNQSMCRELLSSQTADQLKVS